MNSIINDFERNQKTGLPYSLRQKEFMFWKRNVVCMIPFHNKTTALGFVFFNNKARPISIDLCIMS
jgi:hypothetical protein